MTKREECGLPTGLVGVARALLTPADRGQGSYDFGAYLVYNFFVARAPVTQALQPADVGCSVANKFRYEPFSTYIVNCK